MSFISSLFSDPTDNLPSQDEIRQMLFDQQRMNNPNVSNYFGSSQTTFAPDGQASVTQSFSPEMLPLVESMMSQLGQGAPQFQGRNDPYNTGMQSGFSQRLADRGGFQQPQRQPFSQEQSGPTGPTFGINQPEPPPTQPTMPEFGDNGSIERPLPFFDPKQDAISKPIPAMGEFMTKEAIQMSQKPYDWQGRLQRAGKIMQSDNPLADALMAMRGGV
jgi:hypothetical protein